MVSPIKGMSGQEFLIRVNEYVENGLVKKAIGPGLLLLNYTEATQYRKHWDEITLICRGLMIDTEGNLVQRSFKKFFNEGEKEHSNSPVEYISDKVDGSLGILYDNDGHPAIATRGSFHGIQAQTASSWLQYNSPRDPVILDGTEGVGEPGNEVFKDHLGQYWEYPYEESRPAFIDSPEMETEWLKGAQSEWTYLFEIIYPQNRIVVRYGKKHGLVPLGAVHKVTGEYKPPAGNNWTGNLAPGGVGWFRPAELQETLPFLIDRLKDKSGLECEGYVVHLKDGTMLKLKCPDYLRLHRLRFTTTKRSLWEILQPNKEKFELLTELSRSDPNFTIALLSEITKQYEYLFRSFQGITLKYASMASIDTRKDVANHISIHFQKESGALFAAYDGEIDRVIDWIVRNNKVVAQTILSEE